MRYESNVETAVGRCGRGECYYTDELVQAVQEELEAMGLLPNDLTTGTDVNYELFG